MSVTLNNNLPLDVNFLIVKEEANEEPPKLGTFYKNLNREEKLSEYEITEFVKNKIFSMTSKDKNYHVKYTLKSINENLTELDYYEWVEKGYLEDPFTLDILKKLKRVLENK